MLPFVWNDRLWSTGLAGAVPAALCFIAAGGFLFATVRRVVASNAAAWMAIAVFALNPNLLYLQATPMTEAAFLACLLALLYATVRFAESDSYAAAARAGAIASAGTLARYEGWFLLPFAALFIFVRARSNRFGKAALFSAIAASGPCYWLAHNWWYFGNPLDFYNGPGSPKDIYERALHGPHAFRYPGDHDWAKAALYFRTAVRRYCSLSPLILAAIGAPIILLKKHVWPILFLTLTPAFYVWSMESGNVPIFVPGLWPNSWYNTRYATAALPLLAFAAAGAMVLVPGRWRGIAAAAAAIFVAAPWLLHPSPEHWICWKESQVNSVARRAWTEQAAGFLKARYRGGGIFTPSGDITGIYAQADIPLRETLNDGNFPAYDLALKRPERFLDERWAVGTDNDPVAAGSRAGESGTNRLPSRSVCDRARSAAGLLLAAKTDMTIPFTRAHGAGNDFLLSWVRSAR